MKDGNCCQRNSSKRTIPSGYFIIVNLHGRKLLQENVLYLEKCVSQRIVHFWVNVLCSFKSMQQMKMKIAQKIDFLIYVQ